MIRGLYESNKERIFYGIIGLWNTVFGFAVFSVLYYYVSAYVGYLIVLILSYVISITNAYFGYKRFVFKSKGGGLKEYARFYLVYGGAFMMNFILLPVFIDIIHLSAYFSQLLIILINFFVSYYFHRRFTFRKEQRYVD